MITLPLDARPQTFFDIVQDILDRLSGECCTAFLIGLILIVALILSIRRD